MYRSPRRSRGPTVFWPKALTVALLAGIAAMPAFAQKAPTFTLHVLLKDTLDEPDARAFVDTLRSSRALQQELQDPLSIRPAVSLPPLPPELAGSLDPASNDALLRRWVSLTYNATTQESAELKRELLDTSLFEAVDEEPAYSFSYAINDQLYTSTDPNPNKRQWALDTLKLPQAFEWTRGRVLIGAIDGGLPGFFDANGTPATGYPTHPDLEPNVRRHQSYTLPNDNVDLEYGCSKPAKLGYAYSSFLAHFGHGTHVGGIMAALVNNSTSGAAGTLGVSGSCPTCSFSMMQARPDVSHGCITPAAVFAAHNGVSVLNMSFGGNSERCPDTPENPEPSRLLTCAVIADATSRDIALVAASGNRRATQVQFPAIDARIIAVGAIDNQRRLWNEANAFQYPHPGTAAGSTRCVGSTTADGCGSSYGTGLDMVAPGAQIVSTLTIDYRPISAPPPCAVDPLLGSEGYGSCTGTSMASPYVSGIAGLVRSLNPLLSSQDTKAALAAGATVTPGYTATQMGAGVPDAEVSVKRTLGVVAGKTVFNRLTPLFSQVDCDATRFTCTEQLGSGQGTSAWLFTTSPQTAIAAAKGELYYVADAFTNGRPANLAGTNQSVVYFPSFRLGLGSIAGVPGKGVGPSVAAAYAFRNGVLGLDANGGDMRPGASAYVFTGNRDPRTGAEVAPGGNSHLVPLIRMSSTCSNFRKHVYVTDEGDLAGSAGTRKFFEDSVSVACDGSTSVTGYTMDVVEGYIFRAHAPNSETALPKPAGTQALYRHYNATTKAWTLVLESELYLEAAGQPLAGYAAPGSATYGNALLGYVYPNVDRDGDGLVDGFELTVGTDPDTGDSDCDQVDDKTEFPLDALPLSDPAEGPSCGIRAAIVLLAEDD